MVMGRLAICSLYVHRICPYILDGGTNLPSVLPQKENTTPMQRRTLIESLAGITFAAALTPALGWAQSRPVGYPARPVTIIVPFTVAQ